MTDLDVARKQEIRYQLLCLLDSARPDWLDAGVTLRGLKVGASPDDVGRELGYLQSRQLVETRKVGDRQQARLLATGVDLLEGNHPELMGLIILDDRLSQIEKERRKVLRWIVLRLGDRSRPIPLQEPLIQRALHDVSFVVSAAEQKGLVQVDRRDDQAWQFSPTADGVDVCEYVRECPAGVGRPERYQ